MKKKEQFAVVFLNPTVKLWWVIGFTMVGMAVTYFASKFMPENWAKGVFILGVVLMIVSEFIPDKIRIDL